VTRPLLADVATAIAWSGRPSSTLRRWVHEGRITRHGAPRAALYDLRELPEKAARTVPPRRPVSADP
jgi:hypothetical protein